MWKNQGVTTVSVLMEKENQTLNFGPQMHDLQPDQRHATSTSLPSGHRRGSLTASRAAQRHKASGTLAPSFTK